MATYVDLLIDVPRLGDRRFTYRFGQDYPLPYGAKVRVPFGPGKRDGFVVAEVQEPKDFEAKDIEYVYDLRFLPGPGMLGLARVMADYYCAGLASVMSMLWPPVVPRAKPGTPDVRDESALGLNGKGCCSEDAPLPLLVWGRASFRWDQYRRVVKEALQAGKGALVLVPETKDVREAVKELEDLAGDRLLVLHSDLTGLVRRQAWLEAMSRGPGVVLGTRSSVFVDMPGLGVIIVENEWSDSNKSIEAPFYHARTVARMRASIQGCRVVFGSSHPSLDVYRSVQIGETALLKEGPSLPGRVKVVDLRRGGTRRSVISKDMADALRETFQRGESAFLFLNRRGEATQVTCQDCGNTLMCPNCGSPLSYHSKGPRIWCHTCDYQTAPPDECPSCGGHRWRFLGFGIERAQKEFQAAFPGVPLYRLDQDTSRDESPESILARFEAVRPACLLGTQLALNARPRPAVGMVGVLSGDTILNLPDFTASEKVFHLLSELLAFSEERRGTGEGLLVVQTYNPDHHAVLGLQEPEGFYREEMENRGSLGYPPARRLFKVRFSGKNAPRVREASCSFAKNCLEHGGGITVLGPIPSPKPKIRGQVRWQVALRGDDHAALARVYSRALEGVVLGSGVKVSVDVEPVDAS